MITKSAVIYLLLCYLAYPTVAQPTRELSFEFSCSEYQKLRKECEKRIDALEKAEHYMHAAIVCRKLLSDFNREREELTRERTHLEQKNPNISHNTWKMNMLARQMATCYAHLGDFAQAKQLLQEANAITIVQNKRELAKAVIRFLLDANLREAYGERAREVVEANRGALLEHLAIIHDLIGRRQSRQRGGRAAGQQEQGATLAVAQG